MNREFNDQFYPETFTQDEFLLSIIGDVLRDEDDTILNVTPKPSDPRSDTLSNTIANTYPQHIQENRNPNQQNFSFSTEISKPDSSSQKNSQNETISNFTNTFQTIQDDFDTNECIAELKSPMIELGQFELIAFEDPTPFVCTPPQFPPPVENFQEVQEVHFSISPITPMLSESSQLTFEIVPNEINHVFSPIQIEKEQIDQYFEVKDLGDQQQSLAEMYFEECNKFQCYPNSTILKMLSNENMTRFDQSFNFLNELGVRSICKVIAALTTIKEINLSNNGMRDCSCSSLCKILQNHPSVTSIDFSYNPISDGSYILALVKANPKIRKVRLEKTKIDFSILQQIKDSLK
jgi:hypothetical protein